MRPQEQTHALVFDDLGMFGDRQYMWVEAAPHTNVEYHPGEVVEPGHFLSQREDPKTLVKILPYLDQEGLFLYSEGTDDIIFVPRLLEDSDTRIPVSVWGWQGVGVDQGDEAAAWGEEQIGRPVRLVSTSHESPRYVEGDPDLGRVGFADGFPLLVISQASVAELNDYLVSKGKPEVPADRFRANIILDGVEPFGEDFIDTIELVATNGLSVVLKRIKACGRCPIPDTDQLTGERRTHVRAALGKIGRRGVHQNVAKYGDGTEIFFGQNFIVDVEGTGDARIEAGQDLQVTFSETTNWARV